MVSTEASPLQPAAERARDAMRAASGAAPHASRLAAIDWARGLAVLLMFEAHTLDAWTRLSERSTKTFGYLNVLAGMAAPAFLFLAGVSAVLAIERRTVTSGQGRWSRATPVICRGLEIFILAFVFRLQAFLVSPGSAGIALFRVDILNVLGPAVAVTAAVWAAGASGIFRVAGLAALTLVVAVSTPLVRGAEWVSALPIWVQWYLRPAGEHTTFTALPWVGFVFAGGVVGIGLDRFARTDSSSTPLVRWGGLLAGGAAAVWAGRYAASLPSLLPGSSFWTTSPSFFVIRLGLLVSVLAAAGLTEYFWRGGSRWLAPLARLGRHSLFLYWVHIELVYGYLAWPIRKALPLRQVAVAYVLFTVAMYGTLGIRDRLAKLWRSWRQFPRTTARAASV